MSETSEISWRREPVAFVSGAVIGTLGGLIGLGGAEFRLPLLISLFRFRGLEAVILNKATSLVVVAAALPFRANTISFAELVVKAGTHRGGSAVVVKMLGRLLIKLVSLALGSSLLCWSEVPAYAEPAIIESKVSCFAIYKSNVCDLTIKFIGEIDSG